MNHEYDTLSEQYIPLAGSYHSRGMWYFRLYELKSADHCLFCLLIHMPGPGVVRIWIFGIPYLSEFIPRLSVIGRRRIIRIRNIYEGSGHACHNFISTSNQFDMAVGLHA